jgi:protein TonB
VLNQDGFSPYGKTYNRLKAFYLKLISLNMLISKFDLYKSEWLELVFDDRNKQYGAYELRQHNGRTMVKAMLIAFVSVISFALVVGILIKPAVMKVGQIVKLTGVPLINIKPPVVVPPKPIQHTSSTHAALPAVTPQAMTKFVPLVVTEKPVTAEPPKMSTLTGNIGSIDAKGPTGAASVDQPKAGTGTVEGPPNTGVVSDFKSLEVMPVPYGGASAWSKFLSKNLRYPDMAIDQHIQGKVWVSFIIEADGTLSHFKVERGVGYGLDEEALRVLKMAPAWKPGIQNGHPVRVQYTIPINFQLSDEP